MANQGGSNAIDIVEELSGNATAAASTNSDHLNTASPIQQNPKISTGQDDDCCCQCLPKPISCFLEGIARVLIWSIIGIFYILICFSIIFITGNTKSIYSSGYKPNNTEEGDNNKKGSRVKIKKAATKVKIRRLTIVAAVRAGFFVLLWTVINLAVANLRSVTVLGSQLWKWSMLAALILLAYPIIIYLIHGIFFIIMDVFDTGLHTSGEYYIGEIAEGLILALYFTFIFLAWLLCVDTTNAQLHRYGTLTLVSLLVGGVLSLLKSLVLLWWKTTLIYNKYKEQILSAGCHLYFNLLLMDQNRTACITLLSWLDWFDYTPQKFVPVDPKSKETQDHKGRPNRLKTLPIERFVSKKGATVMHVHEVATYLTNNFELSLTEDDDIPDIVPYLQTNFQIHWRPGHSLSETHYFIDKSGEKLLIELLQLETLMENPTYPDFEKWMVDGLKYTYTVGNRIDGAFQVMRILSRVMTAFIVVMVILVWLFITGLATTKVVVGLASIFLGLTFVFGDSCKTFFQGVIFSFVTHPFDVADRCIIDDKELKVKKINILTTTFFGSQSKEIVLYPNSDLATKRIMLLHGERDSKLKPERKAEAKAAVDLSDLVEFILPPKTTSLRIGSLQDTIERHMEAEVKSGVYKNSYCVSLMEFGDNIKMSVDFEHVLSEGDNSEHSESIVMRKKKQRSKLVLRLKKFVEDIGDDVSPS